MQSSVPVTIERIVRRMRGGSQSFLVFCDDGQHYVAKFQRNPQGNRTLVNECIGGNLLRRLGVTTPTLRILRLPDHLESDDLFFTTPDGRQKIAAGIHFGSLCPVNPDRVAIYDFLPETLLEKLLVNGRDFITTFVFDCWAGHKDSRQAIFYRNPSGKGYKASLIDNGMLFGGADWKLFTSQILCRHFNRAAYRAPDMDLRKLAHEAIETIRGWTLSDIDEAFTSIPADWLDGDEDAFWKMAENLFARTDAIFVNTQEWLVSLKKFAFSHVQRKVR